MQYYNIGWNMLSDMQNLSLLGLSHKILMKYATLFTYNYFPHSCIYIYQDIPEVTYFNQLIIE